MLLIKHIVHFYDKKFNKILMSDIFFTKVHTKIFSLIPNYRPHSVRQIKIINRLQFLLKL